MGEKDLSRRSWPLREENSEKSAAKGQEAIFGAMKFPWGDVSMRWGGARVILEKRLGAQTGKQTKNTRAQNCSAQGWKNTS